MRWMPLEVFTAGEPDPYPPGVAVCRRLRAVPLDARPWRTWLLPSVNGIASWQRLYDRRADAVVGSVWIRRSALRWRRFAWSIWALVLLTGITVSAAAPGGGPDPAVGFGGLLVGLALAALLLAAYRVKAVIDPDDGQVGVRE